MKNNKVNNEKIVRTAEVKINSINIPRTTNEKDNVEEKKEEKGVIEQYYIEKEKALSNGVEPKLKSLKESSLIIALGTIENVELWVPINPKDEHSRVLSLSLSSKINFRDEKVTVTKLNVLSMRIVSTEIESEQQDANILINRFKMVMINRHLNEIKGKETQEQLLLPTRISLIYDKTVNLSINSDIQNIFAIIEPLDLKVGIREIINFKDIGALFSDLVDKLDSTVEDADEHI